MTEIVYISTSKLSGEIMSHILMFVLFVFLKPFAGPRSILWSHWCTLFRTLNNVEPTHISSQYGRPVLEQYWALLSGIEGAQTTTKATGTGSNMLNLIQTVSTQLRNERNTNHNQCHFCMSTMPFLYIPGIHVHQPYSTPTIFHTNQFHFLYYFIFINKGDNESDENGSTEHAPLPLNSTHREEINLLLGNFELNDKVWM